MKIAEPKILKSRLIKKLALRLLLCAVTGAVAAAASIWRGNGVPVTVLCFVAAFAAVAVITRLPQLAAPGWDGTVTEKTMRYTAQNAKPGQMLPQYFLTVRSDAGREYKRQYTDKTDSGAPCFVEYYDLGERIRKHRGFDYYEKFEKAGKSTLICVECGELVPKELEICPKCGTPLLSPDIDPEAAD